MEDEKHTDPMNTKTAHEELREWADIKHPQWIVPIVDKIYRAIAEHEALKALLKSIDEEPPDPTLKYLEEKLYTKGEHSLCETIDNTVHLIAALQKERDELRVKLEQSETEAMNVAKERNQLKNDLTTLEWAIKVKDKQIIELIESHQNMVPIEQVRVLREKMERTINENLHLADGEKCTLIHIKQALDLCAKEGW